MAKQKPEFSTVTTENIPLLLAYDKSAPSDPDFREDLIQFLIDSGAINLQCFVATTIYFETVISINPVTTWSNLLHEKFGDTFHYHILYVARNSINKPIYVEYRKTELSNNFDEKAKAYIETKNQKT